MNNEDLKAMLVINAVMPSNTNINVVSFLREIDYFAHCRHMNRKQYLKHVYDTCRLYIK